MKITLDSIRQSIETKYVTYDIDRGGGDIVSLRNPLRMPQSERSALVDIQKAMSDENADTEETLREMIRLVAADIHAANRLLADIAGPDEMAILTEVITGYMESQEVGEASPSES